MYDWMSLSVSILEIVVFMFNDLNCYQLFLTVCVVFVFNVSINSFNVYCIMFLVSNG